MRIARRGFLAGCLARLWAQNQAAFSSSVDVVSILATVRDRDGGIVTNLSQEDFLLWEDGVPQKIRYFSRETGLPLTVGLLVDTSRSQAGVLDSERGASRTFLKRVLRPEVDRAFIAGFDQQVNILQPLTSSRDQLSEALDHLAIPGRYATLIYSAVRECAEQVMRKETGRKAFILLTDGVAFRDDTSLDSAIEFAQRADTILYSIRFSDPVKATRPVRALALEAAKRRGKDALARMAKETGGGAFEVSPQRGIDATYQQIEDALRNLYSIGYTPEPRSAGRAYHKLKLKTRNSSLLVSARDGYYSR